ncbi:MAG: hypothetical protein LBH21_06665, partial [Gracilibacteraceae bacterium]|nr:hypothetical protein [Gracilibacteraceae bacterium]
AWLKVGGLYCLFCFILTLATVGATAAGALQNPTVESMLLSAALVATLCSWIHALSLRRPYLDKMARIKEPARRG